MAFSPKKLLSFILSIALLSGLIRVGIDYSFRFLDTSPVLYYTTFLLSFVLEIIIITYATKRYRSYKGSLNSMDAIKIGVIIMGITGLFYCTMAYVYDTYIDTSFQTDMTIRFTEQYSPDQLEQVKLNIKNQDTSKSYIGIIMYTIWFVFLGAVISLITGSVLKSNKEIR